MDVSFTSGHPANIYMRCIFIKVVPYSTIGVTGRTCTYLFPINSRVRRLLQLQSHGASSRIQTHDLPFTKRMHYHYAILADGRHRDTRQLKCEIYYIPWNAVWDNVGLPTSPCGSLPIPRVCSATFSVRKHQGPSQVYVARLVSIYRPSYPAQYYIYIVCL